MAKYPPDHWTLSKESTKVYHLRKKTEEEKGRFDFLKGLPGNICLVKKWGYNLTNFTSRELDKLSILVCGEIPTAQLVSCALKQNCKKKILQSSCAVFSANVHWRIKSKLFSLLVNQSSRIWNCSTGVNRTSLHNQGQCQPLGPAVPLSMERSPLILHQMVPTFSHLCVRMACLTEAHY